MTHNQEHPIRRGRHCVSALHAHLVFVTKYRRKVFNDEILIRLEQILREVCNEIVLTNFLLLRGNGLYPPHKWGGFTPK